MRKSLLLLSLLLFACAGITAQDSEQASKGVTPESFIAHVEFLADQKMEGRLPGSDCIRKAGDYIAGKLKEWGVEPKGEEGDFFQKVSYKLGDTQYDCRNVIGFIVGTDEKLKDEVIVIMAHYDHLGKGVYAVAKRSYRGQVCPGANDNASGVAGLLEVARVIKENKVELKRSILLLATTGEEAGCRGSKFYVDHPVIPLEKTQAVVNLDQIGGYEDGVAAMGVHMSPRFDEALDKALKGEDILVVRQKIQGAGDNVSFNDRYVPSIFFWTGYGDHYHSPTDTPDTINKEKGAQICRIVARLVTYLANVEKVESTLGKPRGSYRPYLGVGMEETGEGLQVTEVASGSPAAECGMKKNDIIVKLGPDEVKSYRGFINAIAAREPGDEVAITVRRGDKTLELKAILGKR
jgi:hypothetical protein